MKGWLRALVVPLFVVAIWLVPSDRPGVEIAGAAETAALTDIAEDTSSVPEVGDDADPTVTTSTTVVATTTSVTTEAPSTTETADPTTTSTTAAPTTTSTTAAPTTSASTAPPTTEAPVTTRQQSLGEQALQLVSFEWRSAFPNWTVEFQGPRNGIRALTYPDERRIVIYVRSSDTATTLHRVFAHELGHVIDVERNSDEDRARWIQQRGIRSSAPWWPNAEAPDFATGAGDFAEAFAVLETGVTTRSTVGNQPSAADLDLLRELSRG